MAKARLLQAVCAVALLAAAPAFAQQTTTQPATTGAGNSVNAPVMHDQTAPRSAAPSSIAPPEKMGRMDGGMGSHPMHHSAMSGHSGMHSRADNAQNATADQLNEQSYQAAQRGQSFSGSSGTMSPGSSGGMNDMSGSSPVPAASGAGGGGGSK